MPKIYAVYCLMLVSLLGYANHQGYTFASLLNGGGKADKSANRHHK